VNSAPKAIWCTAHAYRSVVRLGVHHLTTRLAARGWDVLFLSNPISPLHLLKWRNQDTFGRLSQAARGIAREGEGLRTLLPVTMLPLTGRIGGRSRWVLDHWPAFTVPNLGATLRRAGFDRPDLMVIDGPIAAQLIDIVKPRRSVLRLFDRLSGFASTSPAMLTQMADLARRVDLVTYSAEDLAADVDALAPRRKLHLSNGVDVGHFAARRAKPAAYAAISEPRAVYVGTMSEWFDFELVGLAARQRPDISFVMIGPPELARRRLPDLPNLHVLGSLPWDELPAYLQHASVGLIPFDVKNHRGLINGVNPLKLYEYAAAGLPVVSVAWPELRKLNAPIELTEESGDFIVAIDRMLASPPSADALRAFAARHDWGFALDRLLLNLEPHDAAPARLAAAMESGI
jgi:glycosyltransferase involved in cell wall biosynthesis